MHQSKKNIHNLISGFIIKCRVHSTPQIVFVSAYTADISQPREALIRAFVQTEDTQETSVMVGFNNNLSNLIGRHLVFVSGELRRRRQNRRRLGARVRAMPARASARAPLHALLPPRHHPLRPSRQRHANTSHLATLPLVCPLFTTGTVLYQTICTKSETVTIPRVHNTLPVLLSLLGF